jgi:hypothetical protein
MPDDRIFSRLALMAEISDQWKSKASVLGRTALMKLCFFLQESRGIPLGYSFSLYSYGPFDSDVLSDLGTAVRLSVLKEGIVHYPSGTGYEYLPGPDIPSVKNLASDFLGHNSTKIKWAVDTFGSKTAGELELLSTTFFVAKYHNPGDIRRLIDQVESIKPHFSREQIQKGVDELINLKLLLDRPVAR